MPFTYNKNIPQATDDISISQGDLLNNFEQLSDAFNVNHVDFNLGPQGKHWFVHFPNQAVTATNPPLTDVDEVGLYAMGGALWFRPVNQAAGDVTNDINLTDATKTTSGSCTLPSGIIFKWGYTSMTVPTLASRTVTFPVPFPHDCFTMLLTLRTTNTAAYDANDLLICTKPIGNPAIDRISQEVTRSAGYVALRPVNFSWFAIGY